MKTPDEIKKALECCFQNSEQCADCPYYPTSCDRELVRDAREYIRQIEAERDALMEYLTDSHWAACDICKHGVDGVSAMNCAHIREVGVPCFEWRGLQKEECPHACDRWA